MADVFVVDYSDSKLDWINELGRRVKNHISEFENNDLTSSDIWDDIISVLYTEAAEKYDAIAGSLSSTQIESLVSVRNLIASNVTKLVIEDNDKIQDEIDGTYNSKTGVIWIRPGLPEHVSSLIISHEFVHKLMHDVEDNYMGYLDKVTNEAMAFFVSYQIVGRATGLDLKDIGIEMCATAMLWGLYLGYGGEPEYRYTTKERAFQEIDRYCNRLKIFYRYLSDMLEELGL